MCAVCLNPKPEGFKAIDKCVPSEMNMATSDQNLIGILHLPHITGQFI